MKCSQKNCENEATWCYVWTSHQYACTDCVQKVLSIARAMGFPTPENTLHPIPVSILQEEMQESVAAGCYPERED
jgi:hypothetical protein